MKKNNGSWKKTYEQWRKASGGKWWLYQYFVLSNYEIRQANSKKPQIKKRIDKYKIYKEE